MPYGEALARDILEGRVHASSCPYSTGKPSSCRAQVRWMVRSADPGLWGKLGSGMHLTGVSTGAFEAGSTALGICFGHGPWYQLLPILPQSACSSQIITDG